MTVSAPTDSPRGYELATDLGRHHYQPGDHIAVIADVKRLGANARAGEVGTVHGYARSGHVEVRLADGQLHALTEDEISPVETTPEQRRRAEFIADLHRMADHLAANRDIPLGKYPSLDIAYYPDGTDAEELAEVERVAAILGVEAGPPHVGSEHIVASLTLGAVGYRAIHVPAEVMADWHETTRIKDQVKAARLAPVDEPQAGA
jgi:hypothetical protein